MPLSRSQKQKIVEDLKDKLSRQKAVIFTNIQGLKVKNLTELRKKLRKEEIDYKMVKKTLFKIALPKNFSEFNLKEKEGEIAAAFDYKDEVSPAKILYQFSRANENLKIIGGIIGGKFFQKEEVLFLAKLPPREQLLAKLVGTINAPIAGFVNVLQGNIKSLLYLLSNLKTQSAKLKTTTQS